MKRLTKKTQERVKEAQDAVSNMIDWGETPQGAEYWCKVYESFDEILKEPEPKREEKGYFDGVKTWSEAIELLTKADKGNSWMGHFENIDGEICFKLGMDNHKDWGFSKGKLLLSKSQEDEDAEGDDDECHCDLRRCEDD